MSASAVIAGEGPATRHAWAEMMRARQPNFGSLSKQEITEGLVLADFLPKVCGPDGSTGTVDGQQAGGAPDSRLRSLSAFQPDAQYRCITQRHSSLNELFIGINQGSAFLWESGSTINWVARRDGYPTRREAILAAQGCYVAAEAWNSVLGKERVQFKYVESFQTACFQLVYNEEDSGGTLAEGFFPDSYKMILNDVRVFPLALESANRDILPNVFAHELGHVLGLRHEFAQPSEDGATGEDSPNGGPESILVGVRNSYSVMAYRFPPRIQSTDVEDCKMAYDKLATGMRLMQQVRLPDGRGYTVTKTVHRVPPDN